MRNQSITERKPIEWKNQVVITTALLAEIYEANEQQIQQNFSNHKNNFTEGKHYFLLQGEELKEFKNHFDNIELVGKRASQLYLWTERGANRHCKILDTDKAWEQFDNLEETYFKVKEIVNTELSPELQMLQGLLSQMVQKELADKERDKKIAEAKETADRAVETTECIKEIVKPVFDNWRNEITKKIRKIQSCTGTDFQTLHTTMYTELEYRAGCDLNTRLRNKKQRMLDNGCKKTEVNKIRKINLVEEDKRLKEIFAKIVLEYEIKYCS